MFFNIKKNYVVFFYIGFLGSLVEFFNNRTISISFIGTAISIQTFASYLFVRFFFSGRFFEIELAYKILSEVVTERSEE